MRETEPIPARRDTPAFHCSIIPPFQANANYAKQTNLPAAGREDHRQGLRPVRLCSGQAPDDATRHPGNDAKQSQFRQRIERVKCFTGAELWSIGHACETKPISRRGRVGRGPRGRGTGANRPKRTQSGGPSCETKAIAPWRKSGRDTRPTESRGAIVRNKANLSISDCGLGRIRAGRLLSGRASRLYKQTRFVMPGGLERGVLPRPSTLRPRPSTWRIVRNKANLGGGIRCHTGGRGVAVLVGGRRAVYNVPRA
jgi:hypothetical protein